jgi:putative ABC transport system permease protein
MLIAAIRHTLRGMRRSPGFAAVAIATLALGIGANAAVFSVADAMLIEPLPFERSERLVSLWEARTSEGHGSSVAPANLAEYQAARSLSHVAAYTRISKSLTGAGEPEQLRGEAVTWNLFDTLGVRPALGRTFRPEEDRRGAARVVILTHSVWRRRFGADPAALGRAIVLNDEPHDIVGVMPEWYRPLSQLYSGHTIDFFAPAAQTVDLVGDRVGQSISAVARLAPGMSIAHARAELEGISGDIGVRFPAAAGLTARLAPLRDLFVGDLRLSLIVLLSAAGLVLLIACVNVANLMIVRGMGQQREVAIRMAVGATSTRILQDLALRGMVLSIIGGAAGLACGLWTRDLLVTIAPATFPALDGLALNWRVFAVTAAFSIAAGTLAGLAPALHVDQRGVAMVLLAGALTTSASRSIARWRGLLMAAEVAAALMLAIGAGLLVRSLARLMAVDLGFEPRGVLLMTLRPPETRYPDQAARARLFAEIELRIAAIPTVDAVSFASEFPLRGGGTRRFLAAGAEVRAGYQIVSPGYFATLGIPLRRGRGLTRDDRKGTPPVAIVSESFARRFHPGDPLGQRLGGSPLPTDFTIVGIVADMRRDGKAANLTPQVYVSAAQTDAYSMRLSEIAVRGDGDPYSLVPSIQRAIWSVDRDQPITHIQTLDGAVAQTMAGHRFNMTLLSALAGLAFLLAVVGVYGVVAHAAAQRTREIGIRMALGADRHRVVALVAAGALKWVMAGLAAGLAGAAVAARFMKAMLFGVAPHDFATFAAAGLLMALVAIVASYLPARRAAGIDPASTLRAE